MIVFSATTIRSRGFTLIEIVLVMGLVISLVGVAVVAANTGRPEKKLREQTGKAEDLVREARRLSILQQRTYVVEFTQGQATLAPAGRSISERTRTETNRPRFSWEEEEEKNATFPEIRRTKTFPEEFSYEIKRWGEKTFSPVEKESKHRIYFEPSGLVEPFALKMKRLEGFHMVELSVLSGAVRYEEMLIPND